MAGAGGGGSDRCFSWILDGFQSLLGPFPHRNVNIWPVFEVFPYPRQVPTHETTTPGSCRARLAGATGGGVGRCFSSILDGFRSLPEPIPHRNVNIWPVFEVFPHPRQVPTHEKNTLAAFRRRLVDSRGGAFSPPISPDLAGMPHHKPSDISRMEQITP